MKRGSHPATGPSRRAGLACLATLLMIPGARAQEPEAESAPLANRLKWSTASEVDNFGYDVYRAESEDGPFERITENPLLGAGTTDVQSDYEYLDESVEPGRTYYYFVESISMSGVRERFTPVISAEPRSPGDAEEPAGGEPGTPPSREGR